MDESSFQQPTPEQLEAFVSGDPLGEDEVLRLLLPQLHHWAVSRYRNIDESEVMSAINRVVTETCRPRNRFNPKGGASLTTYLINLIKLRLNDVYQEEKSIKDSEKTASQMPEKWANLPYKNEDGSQLDTSLSRDAFFEAAKSILDPIELEFLELMKQGEKSLAIFSGVLSQHGIVSNHPHEVKNTKERIIRKLKNTADDHGYKIEDLLGQ